MAPIGAVVLCGGTARRLGGADKASLRVGDRSLLERALAAVAGVDEVVVVGDPVPGVRTVREQPAGGGPAAGLMAGVEALPGVGLVVALAVDMPMVTPGTVARLLRAAPAYDGAVLVDAGGRRQPLCAAYDREALVSAAPHERDGLPLHRLLAPLRLVEVAARGDEADDVDTPEDLRRIDLAVRTDGPQRRDG